MTISISKKRPLIGVGLLLSSLSFASNQQTLQAEIGAYPDTNTTVTGKVTMVFDHQDLLVIYQLNNLAPITNGGVHIHTGTSCQEAAKVGGHYFAPTSAADYWKSAQWVSDTKGNANGRFHLITGLDAKANIGHAVVVHDASGARIGCGILKQ